MDISRIRHVLIVRQDRIGDVILTLPLATALKKSIPGVRVDFLVRGYTASLVRHYEDADHVILLDPFVEKGKDALSQELQGGKYDLAILPNANAMLASAIFNTGIRYRRAGGVRWHMWRFNKWMNQSRKIPAMNELDYNLQLLHGFAKIPRRNEVYFPFRRDDAEITSIMEYLNSEMIGEYVVLHPGSGGSALDLPIGVWGQLVAENPFRRPIILTGSQSEHRLCEDIIAQSGNSKAYNAAGKFNLVELMELIRGADFFMANSTGPLHMARACDVKLLGIYSTFRACHPIRWGPYGLEESNTLLPPGESFNSFAKTKEISRENMRRITIDMVLEKIEKLFP